ncbi:MAG: hypothetical protein F6K48_15905 [Okeania sp. SIO3H1]|nr:hypothetical protein [Okeania sp. SIO3H1]
MTNNRLIMTPDDPGFYEILSNPGAGLLQGMHRQYNGECCFVLRHDEGEMLTPIPWKDLDDYLYGGEYEAVDQDFTPI